MKISTRTRYGIRAMIEITLQKDNVPVHMKTIVKNQGISKKYLHSMLLVLKNSGFLASVRGKNGGYILARKPSEITIYDIFKVLEGSPDLVECVANETLCKRSADCMTRKLWGRISNAVRHELDSITLEDLSVRRVRDDASLTYEI